MRFDTLEVLLVVHFGPSISNDLGPLGEELIPMLLVMSYNGKLSGRCERLTNPKSAGNYQLVISIVTPEGGDGLTRNVQSSSWQDRQMPPKLQLWCYP